MRNKSNACVLIATNRKALVVFPETNAATNLAYLSSSALYFWLMFHCWCFCLQHTSLSPDGKQLVIVGDNPEGLLVDSQSGKVGPFLLMLRLVMSYIP